MVKVSHPPYGYRRETLYITSFLDLGIQSTLAAFRIMKVTGLFLCALSITIATSQAFNLATQAFDLVASLQSQVLCYIRDIFN